MEAIEDNGQKIVGDAIYLWQLGMVEGSDLINGQPESSLDRMDVCFWWGSIAAFKSGLKMEKSDHHCDAPQLKTCQKSDILQHNLSKAGALVLQVHECMLCNVEA